MKLGLSHQKAIDILCTILINDLKFKSRTVAAVMGDKAEDIKEAMAGGDLHVAFNLDPADGVMDIRQIFQLLPMGEISPQLIPTIQWHEQKFGEITGLLPLLKGASQADQAQMRSAMEASVRDRHSRSRLEDMNERVESFSSKLARREMLAMRLVLEANEVDQVVQDKLPPAPYKVRVSIGTEVYSTDDMREIWPSAAQYYQTLEEAQQVAQDLMTRGEPTLRLAYEAANPNQPFVLLADPVEVTTEELWFDTAGKSAEELVREFKVKIEAGSARRQDWNLLTEQNAFLLAEVGQRAAALGDYQTYNRCLNRVQQTLQIPRHERIFFDTQFLQQQQSAAMGEAKEDAARDFQNKASLEIAKQDQKDRGKAQQIVLKGQVDSVLQSERLAAEAAMDPPGGGGWR